MNREREDSTFLRDLHRLLDHLYDPAELLNTPLAHRFDVTKSADPIQAMQRVIVEAIAALRPGQGVPLQSSAWRYYNILFHRYVEQFTQKEVAADLGLSERQLRRQERHALGVLADYLWSHYHLAAQTRADPAHRATREDETGQGEPPAPNRDEELLWSQRTFLFEPAQVHSLVASVLRTVEPYLATSQVAVDNVIPLDLPRLDVQWIPVQEALVNLLLLAARCAPAGRIRIDAAAAQGEIALQIVSEQTGSPKTTLDPEERESLEIARQLVEFSGGRAAVCLEQSPRAVLTLEVVLPAADKPIGVLAIDDNPDTLQLMQRYVSGTRYNLVGIQDPEQAWAWLASGTHQIVILDVMLPTTDGWAFLRRLRTHTAVGEIPVIVCTVLPQEQLALAHGASAFLRKPIGRRDFLAVLDSQIDTLRG